MVRFYSLMNNNYAGGDIVYSDTVVPCMGWDETNQVAADVIMTISLPGYLHPKNSFAADCIIYKIAFAWI